MIVRANRIIQTLIVVFVLLTTPPAFAGKIIYVDDDANGANDGSSWTDAFNFLQDALVVASSGDEIRVAQGIYKPDRGAGITPGDRQATFQLINGVTLKGGYVGFPAPDPNARDIELYETVLSGDLNGDDGPNFTNNADNSYCIVIGSGTDQTTVLDGFTVTAANAYPGHGGGMYNRGCSPTIMNCAFNANSASGSGGGMYNDLSSPKITNCTFNGNTGGLGGGMCSDGGNPILTDCTFTANWAGLGGGLYNYLSDTTLTNCTFTDNLADNSGGGINNEASSPKLINCIFSDNSGSRGGGIYNYFSFPEMTDCTFSENSAGSRGGGMYNHYDSSPTLNNCTFAQNTAWSGGAMYNDGRDGPCNPVMNNCTFNNNSADDYGGAIGNSYSSPTLTNCTFTANSAHWGGGGLYSSVGDLLLKNCVFSGNSAGRGGCMHNSFNSLVLKNCLFTGNSAKNTGGIYNFNNDLFLINCTFAGNSLGIISSSHHCIVDITSCIFWGNAGSAISAIDEVVVTVNYSDMQGGWPGTGNIDTDPVFHDPNGDDDILGTEDDNLRLLPGSPCIDTGDPNYIAGPNETDLDGKPRVIGGRIDMGAYEYEYGQLIPAEARIVPRTINLASKGNWITCYISLPEGYDVADIDPNSILLEDEIKPESLKVDEEQQVAIARFTREDAQTTLEVGDINLKITGQLTDGTGFEGNDIITVIDKGDKK